MNRNAIERFLNSDWAFGLTQIGARRRRFLVLLLGAFLWAFFAYFFNPPTWDAGVGIRFLVYPFRALFSFPVFPVILVLSIFFGLVLFLAPNFLPNVNKRIFRILSVITALLFGSLWGFLAYEFNPPDWDPSFSAQLLVYPFQALFSAHVFRHILVAALAFWLAYRLAALYLDDIFELDDISVSERFVLQAALGSGYGTLSIRDGGVPPEQRESPIVKIGGPGWVRVHLENAALFEEIDGTSRIIGPTGENRDDRVALSAFERLRGVINLRDQIDDLAVEGRTSDGIRVQAEEVHVVYSVYRGNQPAILEQPYPYESEALKRLYYSQGKEAVELAMFSLIRSELSKFISRHSLNEFLASIGPNEIEQTREQEAELSREAAQEAGVENAENGQLFLPEVDFIPRPQMITDLFAAEFERQAKQRGVELKWIGVGTWVTPDEIVLERHLDAWRLSLENLVRGSERELARVQRESQAAEFLRLVQEVPILVSRRFRELPPVERMRRIIIAFHGVLNNIYREDRLPNERAHLREVLVFLSRFTTRRRRDRDGGSPDIQPPPSEPPNE